MARGGQRYCRLLKQQTCGIQVAGAQCGPTRHRSTEQVRRPWEIGCLLAHPLGHFNGVGNPAGQQQRADVCISDVEPHLRSVESARRNVVSRSRRPPLRWCAPHPRL